jgi:hypothetical protein
MTKIYPTTHAKEGKNQQHCPVCNTYVKYSSRYPNYVCAKCTVLATDKDGKKVQFYNVTISGNGVQGKYVDEEKLYRSPFCFIKGIKCKAEEAYLGGVVLRPITKRNKA